MPFMRSAIGRRELPGQLLVTACAVMCLLLPCPALSYRHLRDRANSALNAAK